MKTLGAVLAGGRSSRFGSDKALALYRGRPLIDHAIEALARQCDAVVVIGRDHQGTACAPDWPMADAGPLGGLGGALRHAGRNGFACALTCGVDSIGLPRDLRARLEPGPAYVASQPVLGLWPAAAIHALETVMRGGGRRSMIGFAEHIGARAVKLPHEPANVNTPDDLARWEQAHGL